MAQGNQTTGKDNQNATDERKGLPSASEAHRIIACPGYLFAKKTWEHTQEEESPIAKSGTDTHDAIECMIDGKPVEMTLDETEEFVAEKCTQMHDMTVQDLFGGPDKINKNWVRMRLWMKHNDQFMMSGEPDYFGTDGQGTWYCEDYKRGPKPVPVATKNWQLQTYLTLMAHDEKLNGLKFEKLYGAIFQPLVSSRAIIVKMTVDDCLSIRNQLLRALWKADDPNQPRIPGDHCTYCPVAGVCPQRQSFGLVLQHEFSLSNSLSNEQLLAIYPKLSQIEQVCEKVRGIFKERVARGEIKEYEIYDHPSGHTVNHPNDMFKLVKEYFSDGKEFASLLTVPIGKIREVWVSRFMDAAECNKTAALKAWREQIEPNLIVKDPQKRVRPVREDL